jgi:predicted amidophosphoribosyltransferase
MAGWLRRLAASRPRHHLGAAGIRCLVELLFPPACACCRRELAGAGDGLLVCEACRGLLAADPHVRCPRCAAPVADDLTPGDTCIACRRVDFDFDAARALGDYNGARRLAALRLKHVGQEPLAAAIAELLGRRFAAELATQQFDAVLNTPMHWWRRARRGTNGPELLAAGLAGKLKIEHLPRCLACCRLRQSQDMLSRTQRFSNVRGAFAVRRGYRLRGARLLVVDDVMTTGATAGELARVLKRAGAATVWIAVLARAGGQR